jgi:hypothetical protein
MYVVIVAHVQDVCGDCNCFFRAVCLQLAHVQGRHENHMKMYVATVTVSLEQYVFSWLMYKVYVAMVTVSLEQYAFSWLMYKVEIKTT